MTLHEAMQRALGALADIGHSADMTLAVARQKAKRVYAEVQPALDAAEDEQPKPRASETKRYLGDGVYVDVDAFGAVILTTKDGYEEANRIVLEPDTLAALLRALAAWDTDGE